MSCFFNGRSVKSVSHMKLICDHSAGSYHHSSWTSLVRRSECVTSDVPVQLPRCYWVIHLNTSLQCISHIVAQAWALPYCTLTNHPVSLLPLQTSSPAAVSGAVEGPHTPGTRLQPPHHPRPAQQSQSTHKGEDNQPNTSLLWHK